MIEEYKKQLQEMGIGQIIDQLGTLERNFSPENFEKIAAIAWEMVSRHEEP